MKNIKPILKGFPKTTSLLSLFFLLSMLFVNLGVSFFYKDALAYEKPEVLGIGGPMENVTEELGAVGGSVLYPEGLSGSETDVTYGVFEEDASVLGLTVSFPNASELRNGIKVYKVQKNDTISSVAARFGITIETLKLANPKMKSRLVIGEELIVLPVSGILYTTGEGDTLDEVADKFHVDQNQIRLYNPDFIKLFSSPNQTVIIPHAKPSTVAAIAKNTNNNLPNLVGYFILPAKGWNWGTLHEYNAVDIADSCGSPIYVSADGVVVEESSDGSWNSGYGNFILVEHTSGVKTRYAHTLKNLVNVGDVLNQGTKIALIGNSGNTKGETGCHLHFEVLGAKNPFAVK